MGVTLRKLLSGQYVLMDSDIAWERLLHVEDTHNDCHCGHSWYDHIGWREGTSDSRVSCRIVRCGCEAYTESLG